MHVIAIDVGTSVIKALRLDETGAVIAQASKRSPNETAAGVDPGEVWAAVCRVLSQVANAPGELLAGIIVTGQGDGLWRIDGDGHPLASYQWNSTKAANVVRRWTRDGTIEDHFHASGTVLWPGTSAALWVWLSEADPEEAARTAAYFTAKDWIGFKLSGRVATDVTDATIPFLDPATGEYSPAAFDRLGCSALTPMAPQVLMPGDELGQLSDSAAEATGLPKGTPVHVGCLDGAAMLFGLGLNQVGDSMAILGTTVAAVAISDQLPLGQEPSGAVLRLGPGRYYRIMGGNSGTTTLEWFLESHGYEGEDRYNRYWSDCAASTGHLLMLPYLAGERAPFLEPAASGAYIGVTPRTTVADFAKATVEGITFALRLGLDAVGGGSGSLLLTGGGAQRREWCQLVADVTRRPVEVDTGGEASLRGVASLVPGFSSLADPRGQSRAKYQPGSSAEPLEAKYREFSRTLLAFRGLWKQHGEK
jgi:sugar (pentulose or hexulose) kinase